MKSIIKTIIILVILAAGLYGAYYFGLFDEKELKIENTANVVEDIQKIGEFNTAYYYEDMVLKQSKKAGETTDKIGSFLHINTDDEVVIIASGKVSAGFNFAALNDSTLKVQGDTVDIKLPEVQIFDVTINPSDYDVYIEDGDWSHEEISKMITEARDSLTTNAVKNGILASAKENGLNKVKLLFNSLGFTCVNLEVQQ